MNEQEKYNWMVYVSCMTYNQAQYIEDAMNGFTMQETNFPFVCAVVDDASTDGEQEVIKSYLNEHFDLEDKNVARHEETNDYVLTFARHKTNKNCYFAVLYLKYNHYSIKKSKIPYIAQWRENAKYIALCEGDDYWITPQKLVRQVDYLESNKNCNLVYTDVNSYNQESRTMSNGFFNHGAYRRIKNTYHDEILWGWFLAPCTWVYRNSIVKIPTEKNPNVFYGDLYIALSLIKCGELHFFSDITSVYRILLESASHSTDPDKKFEFWRKIRYTKALFASQQSVLFRINFFLLNSYIAFKALIKDYNQKKANDYRRMLAVELKVLFCKQLDSQM